MVASLTLGLDAALIVRGQCLSDSDRQWLAKFDLLSEVVAYFFIHLDLLVLTDFAVCTVVA